VISADGVEGWLLRQSRWPGFTALVFGAGTASDGAARAVSDAAAAAGVPVETVRVPLDAAHALAAERYDAQDGTVYLLRPDQHICGRWRHADATALRAALNRALAKA